MAVGYPLFTLFTLFTLVTGHANWINRKELIAGLQRAMGFSEYRNRSDSDVTLHKDSVVAVHFNLS